MLKFLPSSWRYQVRQKRRYLSVKQFGVTLQKAVMYVAIG